MLTYGSAFFRGPLPEGPRRALSLTPRPGDLEGNQGNPGGNSLKATKAKALPNDRACGMDSLVPDCHEIGFDLAPYVTGALRDSGCQWSPSCLACPLPKCKHDLTRAAD